MSDSAPFDPEDFLRLFDLGYFDGRVAAEIRRLSDAQVALLTEAILKRIKIGKTA